MDLPRGKAGNVIPFPGRRYRLQSSEDDQQHAYRAALVEDAAVRAVNDLHNLGCLISAACISYDHLKRAIRFTPKPALAYLPLDSEVARIERARELFGERYPGARWLEDLLSGLDDEPYADEILQGLVAAMDYETTPFSVRRLRQASAKRC